MFKIIAFCGVDGSGKSTLLNMLENRRSYDDAVFIRKNYSSSVDLIKKYHKRVYSGNRDWIEGRFAKSVSFASALDFLNHYKLNIDPLSQNLKYIFCDRYSYCFWAYMLMTKHSNDISYIFENVNQADIIVYIETDINLLEDRYSKRGGASEDESKELMSLYHESYNQLFSKLKIPIIRVKNTGTIDEAYDNLTAALDAILAAK